MIPASPFWEEHQLTPGTQHVFPGILSSTVRHRSVAATTWFQQTGEVGIIQSCCSGAGMCSYSLDW